MDYKAQLRIPTSEQYAYIEVSVEGSPESIVDAYREFSALVKPKAGLTPKEFNTALDRYLTDGTGETEVYLAMSPSQQACIQEIKKAYQRLETKAGREPNNRLKGLGRTSEEPLAGNKN